MLNTSNFETETQKCVVIDARVYDALLTKGENGEPVIAPKVLQANNPIWCTNFSMDTYDSISVNNIVNTLTLKDGKYEDADLFLVHPFNKNTDKNENHQVIVIHGDYYKVTKSEYDKHFYVSGAPSPASAKATLEYACQEKLYTHPFVMVIPRTPDAMFDLFVRYMPNTAIKEVDNEPPVENLQIPVDVETEVNLDDDLHNMIQEMVHNHELQSSAEKTE